MIDATSTSLLMVACVCPLEVQYYPVTKTRIWMVVMVVLALAETNYGDDTSRCLFVYLRGIRDNECTLSFYG